MISRISFSQALRPCLILSIACLAASGCQQANSEEESGLGSKVADTPLPDDTSRASYLLGYQQTQSLKQQTQGVLQLEAYAAGVREAAAGADSRVPLGDQQRLMTVLNEAITAKQQVANQAIVEEGTALLLENGARPGVTTLPSGLQYEVLQAGDGPKPGPADTVVTHYHGTLPDGTVFDSSVDRGSPASFRVDRVIAGWTEALQLMGVGAKWRLVIPADLAYGERGAGGSIPPNATLVFEVELIEIN